MELSRISALFSYKLCLVTWYIKASVKLETTNILNTSKISFTPIDISNAFKSLKLGKAGGVDGVSAEHFLYAHNVLHVLFRDVQGFLNLYLMLMYVG